MKDSSFEIAVKSLPVAPVITVDPVKPVNDSFFDKFKKILG